VQLADSVTPVQQALLCDPQTSGGLLVACAPEAVEQVLEVFRRNGFADAAVVGEMTEGVPGVAVAV
jgi:selenide,water dikinase